MCVVVDDGKPGTSVRGLMSKRRDDERTARCDRPSQHGSVGVPLILADEEVEDGSVVPKIPGPVGLELRHVSMDPTDHRSASGQPAAGPVERDVGQIEHRHVVVSEFEEVIDQPAVSPTDIDHGVAR